MKKKKIVHIVESFGGGVFSYLVDLTSVLSKEYDVYILYGIRSQTPSDFMEYFDDNVKFIRIKNFARGINPINDLRAYFEIKRIISNVNPDIIHLHSSKAGGLGRLLKYKNSQRVFYTPHGYSFLNLDGSREKRWIYFILEKILGKRRVVTIACSKSEYLESKKVTQNSTFISNSVDTDYLSDFHNVNSNSEDIIFTVGRIDEQKNPYLFNRIAQKMPNVQFIWFGDGPCKDILTSRNISVSGWLSREEILEKVQPYKYFILTSKWEGLPISLLEAMFFSKICFATNVSGNSDVIDDDQNGYLFEDLGQFIVKFKNCRNLGNEANKTVVKNFSKKKMMRHYINLYESNNKL